MRKCPQSISSILTHQEHNSFLPASLNLSKDFSYTLGEEGWGLEDRGGKGRGLQDGSSKARSWGQSSSQGCGEQGNRGPDIATCFSPGSFLSKANLLGDHDKDTISTIKRLFCPFPPFLYFLSPVHSPPPPLPNVLYHYLSYCLHTNMATTDMDAFSTEKSQQALTSIWPVLIKDLGLSA